MDDYRTAHRHHETNGFLHNEHLKSIKLIGEFIDGQPRPLNDSEKRLMTTVSKPNAGDANLTVEI
jgi:hypothetical protein